MAYTVNAKTLGVFSGDSYFEGYDLVQQSEPK